MSLHGFCPHGHRVKKAQTLAWADGAVPNTPGAATVVWTHEQRPSSCVLCAEAVAAGSSVTLDSYIQHPYPHEEGQ